MERAFWDLLEEELKEDPPVFTQALTLLGDVKKALLSLLMPQQKRIIDSINGKLDLELIAQQAENGVLDFNGYAQYVINLMEQLCAPVRDDAVAALRYKENYLKKKDFFISTMHLITENGT